MHQSLAAECAIGMGGPFWEYFGVDMCCSTRVITWEDAFVRTHGLRMEELIVQNKRTCELSDTVVVRWPSTT